MKDAPRPWFQQLLAYLFLGIFSVAAIYLTYTVITTLIKTEKARDWVQIEGTLLNQNLDTIEDNFKSINDLSDSSQRLIAHYVYTFDGQLHQGNNVDFSGGRADNFSSGRKARQQKLLDTKPLIVHVNPQSPSESVIDPSLPAEQMLFFTFFLLFPCGFAVYVMIATALLPFKRWGKLTSPLSGIFHGGLAFWLLVFYHDQYGFKGLILLTLMSCLFFAGLYYLVRHDKLRDWPKL